MSSQTEGDGPGWAAKTGRTSKRSQTVSLVLLAGAGAAAIGLGSIDPTQREEDVLVYADSEACILAKVRTEADCRSEYVRARAAYPRVAPRYASLAECERHHGPAHCVQGDTVTEDARDKALPRMAAYLIGRTPQQEIEPQPLFEHAPRDQASQAGVTHAGGYCTGGGSRIVTSSGGHAAMARVASSAVRPASFGGFGATGRGFSSASSGGGHAAHGGFGSGG